MNTLEAIKARRSIRNYNSTPVEDEKLKTILEAGAHAPNGAGVEVFYSVVRNCEVLEEIRSLARTPNQAPDYDPFYGATTVVVLSAEPHPIGCDQANAACAAENMLLAATELGVGSIYLLGFVLALKNDAATMQKINIPEGKVPLLGIALGYSDEAPAAREVAIKNVTYID
ncbi:MAG: nitroreductase family protein [Coriobacteriia bacterium]|nr:nitroreductase family protein [Coriobacteriia bacterium]